MKIKASSVYHLEVFQSLSHLNMYKGKNPVKRIKIWFILSTIVTVIDVLDIIIFGFSPLILLPLSLIVVATLYNCYLYFWWPRIQYKATSINGDLKNNFIFYDDCFEVSSTKEGYTGNSKSRYDTLFKIVENSKYLFLFEGKFRAYIVDKSTIKNDEIELLRAKLFEVIPSDKYIICKGW